MSRLRRSDCTSPGIARRRRGRGFEYLGRRTVDRIDDPATLDRIRALSLPPAWTDVWICSDPNGHLQAVGTDAAGRRQYRYHDRWRERRDQEKFDQMLAFARALPRLRKRAAADLSEPGHTRELACAVRLLDRGFFRVGGEEYAEGNGSYGLATLEPSTSSLQATACSSSTTRRRAASGAYRLLSTRRCTSLSPR